MNPWLVALVAVGALALSAAGGAPLPSAVLRRPRCAPGHRPRRARRATGSSLPLGQQAGRQRAGRNLLGPHRRTQALADGLLRDAQALGDPLLGGIRPQSLERVDHGPAGRTTARDDGAQQGQHGLRVTRQVACVALDGERHRTAPALGPLDRGPGQDERRAGTGARAGRQRLVDLADPDPDAPGLGPKQPQRHVDGQPGVVQHGLHLVPHGPLEGSHDAVPARQRSQLAQERIDPVTHPSTSLLIHGQNEHPTRLALCWGHNKALDVWRMASRTPAVRQVAPVARRRTGVEWVAAGVPAVLVLGWFWLPGLVVLRVLAFRGLGLVAVAPLVTLGVLGATAILAERAGVAWGPATAVGGTAIAVGIAWLARRLDRGGQPAPVQQAGSARWMVAAVAVGVAAQIVPTFVGMQRPGRLLDAYDAVVHLNTIRYVQESGSASSLTVSGVYSAGQDTGCYPAAWHGVTALVPAWPDPATVFTIAAFLPTAVAWTTGIACLLYTSPSPRD